jgi:hypothetical protein
MRTKFEVPLGERGLNGGFSGDFVARAQLCVTADARRGSGNPKETAMNKLAALTLILATLSAFSPSAADAKPRPTVDDGPLSCFADPDSDTDFPDGIIVSCCYDDGCWICENNAGQNCVWDPKYRMVPMGDLTVSPGHIKLKAPKGLAVDAMSRVSTGG